MSECHPTPEQMHLAIGSAIMRQATEGMIQRYKAFSAWAKTEPYEYLLAAGLVPSRPVFIYPGWVIR